MNSNELCDVEDAALFNSLLPVRSVPCAECRHWRKIRDEDFTTVTGRVWPGPHGECNAIRFSSQAKGAWLTNHLVPGEDLEAPYGVNTHVDQSLITSPTFVCLLGERRVE